MKWVKANERLPEIGKMKFMRAKGWGMFIGVVSISDGKIHESTSRNPLEYDYEFIEWLDESEQSEPLPDSGRLTKEEILYKHSSNSMTKYPNQIRTEVLAAMEEYKNQELAAASTVSEATTDEDTIGFAEWVVSDNNPAPNKYNSDDDNNGKWCDAFSEGINRHYYTTEQLYKIYRKQ